MFTFSPMSEEEINLSNLMEIGTYNFEVVKSTRKISKSGNQMAELCINVFCNQGKQYLIYDYLIFSTIHLNIKKVKHFCDSVGLAEGYKIGKIPEDLSRLCGKVQIGIKKNQPNPNGGFYPDKNIVIDYIASDKKNDDLSITIKDDSIPF